MNHTEANRKARKIIAHIAEEKNITTCEARLPGCMGTFGLAPAHQMKRIYYQGDVERLADYNEWIAMCVHCHQVTEDDRSLNEKIFNKLRPRQ